MKERQGGGIARRSNRIRCATEGIAKRAREGLVRVVTNLQRQVQNIRSALSESTRGLGETSPARIAHERQSGLGGKRAGEMKRRHAGHLSDIGQGEFAEEM